MNGRITCLGTLLIGGYATAASAQSTWPRPSSDLASYRATLDSTVPKLLAEYNVPGAAVMLLEHGAIALVRMYGFADPARTAVVSPTTVFGVASLSKLVAAWGVMHLVDEGKVRLDEPLGRYLSARHRAMLAFDPNRITLRQALSHTAGLSLRSVPEFWPPDSVPSLETELGGKTSLGEPLLRLVTEPGTKWAYSGGGYGLAQLVVEDVTQKPFATYMKAAVFDPLGMKDTRFGNPELKQGAVAYHTDETGLSVVRAGYPNLAAAALYTTISDFGKLVIEDMTRGRTVAGVLAPADFDTMENPAPGTGGTYGLGYFIETTPGSGFLVGHDGTDVGWNSMYRSLPKSGDAFIMFTSGSHGLSAYISPLCGWLGWKTGVKREDYCTPSSTSVMVTLFREGEAAAVDRYDAMKRTRADFDIPEPYWAFLARGMIARHNVAAGLSLFRLIAALHPASATAFASLGAGYVAAQAYDAARASYRKALEIDPKLDRARAALDSLKAVAP